LLNPDFRDMLSASSAGGAEFLLVGAYALAAHGLPRATGDVDIGSVVPKITPNVYGEPCRDSVHPCAPLAELSIDDLQMPNLVFQVGVAPRRIVILTSIDGVEFDEARSHREVVAVEGLSFAAIGRSHLIQNKKSVGWPQDLADVVWLERAEG